MLVLLVMTSAVMKISQLESLVKQAGSLSSCSSKLCYFHCFLFYIFFLVHT